MGKNYNLKKYYRAIDFIESLSHIYWNHKIRKEKRVRHMKQFLKLLGDPQKDYKIIHITGTSGKGTVASLIHAALVKEKFKTGLYTSPHTTTHIERIRINQRYIAAEAFYHIIGKMKEAYQKMDVPVNHHGTLIALALKYFSEEKCQYVVLEAHAGGKYDQTNTISKPEICIITNVQHDHTGYLGSTLLEIAEHKAGIIKKGTKFFTAETNPKVLKLFREKCKKVGAEYNQIKPQTDFQKTNIALAQAVIKKLGLNYKITKSLADKAAKLPCRLEQIQDKPRVILDGAHNPSKIIALTDFLKKQKKLPDYTIIGISANKDWRSILKILLPFCNNVIFTKVVNTKHSYVDPIKMQKYATKNFPKIKSVVYWDSFDALNKLLKTAKKNDFILITGSMYVAGELRRHWIPENYILTNRRSFKLDDKR